ncbi:MAG: LacI family transcriptional regulator [Firmicutes bacterium]|nr:LacI family transcriptional regulator [Bacillota bacterium]
MRVTLEQIAAELGVSRSTVSRALRDSPRISKTTRDRVKALAAQMGYIPNDVARSLRTNRTGVLGFITQALGDTYPGDILRGVQNTALNRGYCLLSGCSEVNPGKERKLVTDFLAKNVDGLIIAPVASSKNISFFRSLLKRNLPIIFVDRHLPEVEIGYVTTDNFFGAYEAVSYLIQRGYKRILCIAGLEGACFEAQERVRGYRQALADNDLSYEKVFFEDNLEAAPRAIQYSYELMKRELEAEERPDAVFAINDAMALGAVRACLEAGFDIPNDIGIIGFDNLEIGEYLPISLSSVQQPKYEIGVQAVNWILDSLNESKAKEPLRMTIKPKLVIRESTR